MFAPASIDVIKARLRKECGDLVDSEDELLLPPAGHKRKGKCDPDVECKYSAHAQKYFIAPADVPDFIRALYSVNEDEKGHRITGHRCLTHQDLEIASATGSDLLYGEILPPGVAKILDEEHLDAGSATTLFDLGMGLGKAAMQAFLSYPNIKKVVGVELAMSRVSRGMAALARMMESQPSRFDAYMNPSLTALQLEEDVPLIHNEVPAVKSKRRSRTTSDRIELKTDTGRRSIEFRQGNLFDVADVAEADIVICETKIPDNRFAQLCTFLARLKPGARLLTYENLDELYRDCGLSMPFSRLPNNDQNDRFFTSWATMRGHWFHLWVRSEAPLKRLR